MHGATIIATGGLANNEEGWRSDVIHSEGALGASAKDDKEDKEYKDDKESLSSLSSL